MIVLGLISGTSADAIDVAVMEIEGAPPVLSWRLISHREVAYAPSLRDEVFACFRPETGSVNRLCALNFSLGRAFAAAALQAMEEANLTPDQVDLIGSHGQTLWHIPGGPDASTLQLGEATVIAEETGVTTVSNFRTRDMAAGGQGAPLVAYVDALLLSHPNHSRAAQNIGGIANVTFLPPAKSEQVPFAFDTGPGNMLIDHMATLVSGGRMTCDRDGALAAQGKPDPELLSALLREPYLHRPPPKTTGRELFGSQYGAQIAALARARDLTDDDLLATVTAFTAQSIAAAYRAFLPDMPAEVIVSGGGVRNPTLMAMLQEQFPTCRVISSDDCGLPSAAKEAMAFAVLAYETWYGRASNLPPATGAGHPVVMGSVTPGRRWREG